VTYPPITDSASESDAYIVDMLMLITPVTTFARRKSGSAFKLIASNNAGAPRTGSLPPSALELIGGKYELFVFGSAPLSRRYFSFGFGGVDGRDEGLEEGLDEGRDGEREDGCGEGVSRGDGMIIGRGKGNEGIDDAVDLEDEEEGGKNALSMRR